jgi:hypothetical protein
VSGSIVVLMKRKWYDCGGVLAVVCVRRGGGGGSRCWHVASSSSHTLASFFLLAVQSRPYGVALPVAGVDDTEGLVLYHTDPSGTFVRFTAKAIGSSSEGAQTNLQEALVEGNEVRWLISGAVLTAPLYYAGSLHCGNGPQAHRCS